MKSIHYCTSGGTWLWCGLWICKQIDNFRCETWLSLLARAHLGDCGMKCYALYYISELQYMLLNLSCLQLSSNCDVLVDSKTTKAVLKVSNLFQPGFLAFRHFMSAQQSFSNTIPAHSCYSCLFQGLRVSVSQRFSETCLALTCRHTVLLSWFAAVKLAFFFLIS